MNRRGLRQIVTDGLQTGDATVADAIDRLKFKYHKPLRAPQLAR